MPHIVVNLPSGTTAMALLPLALLVAGLVVYALVRLTRAERVPYLPKWLWAVIIVVSVPWGAVAYLLLARDTRVPEDSAPVARTDPDRLSRPREVAVAPAPADDRPLVSTSRLTRDYGAGAGLFGVDLCIPRGAVYGLVGPNGAGKTTLLSILAGIRHADSGALHVGVPRGAMAVCPDAPEFEPWLTAFEVVDLARHYVAPDVGAEAVWQALETTGLVRKQCRAFCIMDQDHPMLAVPAASEPQNQIDRTGQAGGQRLGLDGSDRAAHPAGQTFHQGRHVLELHRIDHQEVGLQCSPRGDERRQRRAAG